jgi:hypothetical protein
MLHEIQIYIHPLRRQLQAASCDSDVNMIADGLQGRYYLKVPGHMSHFLELVLA